MVGTIRQKQHDGVAIIALSQPPMNRLTAQMRHDLDQALRAAFHDPAITAILLHGLGAGAKGLSAGLDLDEVEPAATPPQMADRILERYGSPLASNLAGASQPVAA